MGQGESACTGAPAGERLLVRVRLEDGGRGAHVVRGVAAQVVNPFEKANFETRFSLYRRKG
jgi:hypothetical protein